MLTAAVVTPISMAVACMRSFYDRTGNASHRMARIWARTILWVSRVRVEVIGSENLDPTATYIFAANHTSVYDILALLAHLPVQFRWLAKKELFRIPFFGTGMRMCGYIPIDRSNPRQSVRSLNEAAARIRAGASVVIFPEGTRSTDGVIAPFKRGGFTLAARAGQPVVPLSISGAHRILQTKSLKLHPGCIKMVLGKPVTLEGQGRAGQDRLMETVRNAVLAGYDPDYGAPRAIGSP